MTNWDNAIFKKNFTALVNKARERGFTAAEAYDQIYGISGGRKNRATKTGKMVALKDGDVSISDVMKIRAWKDLSLDWLLLGKGELPPELQTGPGAEITYEPKMWALAQWDRGAKKKRNDKLTRLEHLAIDLGFSQIILHNEIGDDPCLVTAKSALSEATKKIWESVYKLRAEVEANADRDNYGY